MNPVTICYSASDATEQWRATGFWPTLPENFYPLCYYATPWGLRKKEIPENGTQIACSNYTKDRCQSYSTYPLNG